jgi:hypothetical protein
MCTVSMVAADWQHRWPQWVPVVPPTMAPLPAPNKFDPEQLQHFLQRQEPVTREEFDALKAELVSLKKLLEAAKRYDDETGQADCEDAEKVRLFRRLAELVDIDLSTVFTAASTAEATKRSEVRDGTS